MGIDAAYTNLPAQHVASGLRAALDDIQQADIRSLRCDSGCVIQQARQEVVARWSLDPAPAAWLPAMLDLADLPDLGELPAEDE